MAATAIRAPYVLTLLAARAAESAVAGGPYERQWYATTFFPAGWALALAVACLVAGWWLMTRESGQWPSHRRWSVWLLRSTAYLALAWMLLGWVVQPTRRQRADLPVLLDNSQSMNRVDDARQTPQFLENWEESYGKPLGEPSRWNLARSIFLSLAPERRAELNGRYRMRIINLQGQQWPSEQSDADWQRQWKSLSASLPESPLGQRLQQLLGQQRGRDTAAVVLLTDGAETGQLPLAQAARQLARAGVPLWIVPLGSASAQRDLRIQHVNGPPDVWLGDMFAVEVSLAWQNLQATSVQLVVTEATEGRELARQEVRLADREPSEGSSGESGHGQLRTTVVLEAQGSGHQQLAIEVEAVEGETRTDNNRQLLDIQVHDETTRVLLAASAPSYELRYLHNLLRRLEAGETARKAMFEVTAVVQQADPVAGTGGDEIEAADRVQANFPATRDQLAAYDVFVLGDLDPSRIPGSSLEDLRELVTEQGKGLLLFAGPEFMPQAFRNSPLAEAFPFEWSQGAGESRSGDERPWQWGLTPLGEVHAHLRLAAAAESSGATWEGLPGAYWLWSQGRSKPGAMVLVEAVDADGSRTPAIATGFWGRGRVVWHANDETYRWRVGGDESYYARYWLQTLHFLHAVAIGPSQIGHLWTARTTYTEQEPVLLTAQLAGQTAASDGWSVHLQGSDSSHRRIPLHPVDGWPGRMEAEIDGLAPGTYQASLRPDSTAGPPATCSFQVLQADPEAIAACPTLEELQRLAQATGGRCLPYERVDELWGALPPGRSVVSAALPPEGLWNAWWMALVVVGLLGGEWLLRWKWGYW